VNTRISASFLLIAAVLSGCAQHKPAAVRSISSQPFGKTPEGESVDLYTLTNTQGASAAISNYGGVVVSLKVPDRNGAMGDVVLGFDKLDGYTRPGPHFGAIIGRYANRIAKGKFTLDGMEYTLAKNNGDNSLHGGIRGFDKQLWIAKEAPNRALELNYVSKDGEEGFPGNLAVTVTYTLTDNNELQIDYSATTDKTTVINLTNHSYFNLAGEGQGDVLSHQVTIYANRFTPVDPTLIPIGQLMSVAGTPFDFRQAHAIGERINAADEQLKFGKGYDHNFVLNTGGAALDIVARITEPKSGRIMDVLTTEPGLQFYTANTLKVTGKGGKVYGPHSAFCMETQHFPDSPNQPDFPSVVLKPGGRLKSTTVYRFSTNSRQ